MSSRVLFVSNLGASVHGGLHGGHWVVCFGHFAHEGIQFCTIDVVPSASLQSR